MYIRLASVIIFILAVLAAMVWLAVLVAVEMRYWHPECAELRRLRDTPETYARFQAVRQEEKDWCRVPDFKKQ